MTQTRRDALKLMGAAAATTILPTALIADDHAAKTEEAATDAVAETAAEGPVTHEVLMLNRDPDNKRKRNVLIPDLLVINPGDTVKFVSVDKGHNSQTTKGMTPEGAEKWKSKLSKDFEVTITVEGTYGYNCAPHASLGMVGLILCGDASGNYEASKEVKQRGKAKKVFKDIFERADVLIAG